MTDHIKSGAILKRLKPWLVWVSALFVFSLEWGEGCTPDQMAFRETPAAWRRADQLRAVTAVLDVPIESGEECFVVRDVSVGVERSLRAGGWATAICSAAAADGGDVESQDDDRR